jgi:acetoin utilization protein AcuC
MITTDVPPLMPLSLLNRREKSLSRFAVLYDEKLKEYDLGHVLRKDRYQNFIDHFQEKLGNHPDFEIVSPSYATEDDLKLVHTEDYIKRIYKCESIDPHDTPLSPGFVRATKLLAGAGKLAGELVQSGRCEKAFVVGGGVQHATRNREKGFGVFSDVGICAENLMQNFNIEKILIVDTDAHAGDGIYSIFSEDPRVLFISIHQHPLTLYPGTGFIDEVGKGDGRGYSVNIPLPPEAGDFSYEYIMDKIVLPLSEAFLPDILLLVDGCDTHFTDQITQMGLTLRGIRLIGEKMGQLASDMCEGKIVDFVGSGYSRDQNIVSLGWLASITGVTGVQIGLEEIQVIPPCVRPDNGFEEAKETVRSVKKELAPYWKCLDNP